MLTKRKANDNTKTTHLIQCFYANKISIVSRVLLITYVRTSILFQFRLVFCETHLQSTQMWRITRGGWDSLPFRLPRLFQSRLSAFNNPQPEPPPPRRAPPPPGRRHSIRARVILRCSVWIKSLNMSQYFYNFASCSSPGEGNKRKAICATRYVLASQSNNCIFHFIMSGKVSYFLLKLSKCCHRLCFPHPSMEPFPAFTSEVADALYEIECFANWPSVRRNRPGSEESRRRSDGDKRYRLTHIVRVAGGGIESLTREVF